MQLAILLVVVCSVTPTSDGWLTPEEAVRRLLEALALVSIAPLAGVVANEMAKHRLRLAISHRDAQRLLQGWQTILTWLWAGSCLAALYLAHWPAVVRSLEVTTRWPLLDELLILAPLLASLLLVWNSGYTLERLLLPLADADAAQASLRQYLELRVRHFLGLILLPALAVIGLQEVAGRFEGKQGSGELQAWWLWCGLLAATLLALPLALKWLWRTQRVADSPLKQRLLTSCRGVGCPVRDIVVWRTGGTVANAAVAGLIPRLRTIFLSDALLAQLSDDEIEVVVRHEAAHLSRHHLWQRLALLALPVLLYLAMHGQFPVVLEEWQARLSSFGISPALQASLFVPLAALTYAAVVVGWLARLHEHDADLAACLVPIESACPGALAVDPSAVAHLHSALRKVLGGSEEFSRRRWLHPSGHQRVAFLQQLTERPSLAARFRSRVVGLFVIVLAACLVAVAAGFWPH